MKNTILVYISCIILLFCSLQNTSASHSWDEENFSNSVLIDGIDHEYDDTIYRLYIHHPSNASISSEILGMKSLPDYNPIPSNFDLTFLYESKIKQIEDIMVTNPDAEASSMDNLLIIMHKTSFIICWLEEVGRDQRVTLRSNSCLEWEYSFNSVFDGSVSELNYTSVLTGLDETGIQFFYLYQTESSDFSYPDDHNSFSNNFEILDILIDFFPYIFFISIVLLSVAKLTFLGMFSKILKMFSKILKIFSPSQKH